MCNEYRFKQSLDRIAREFAALNLPLHWAGGAPNLEPRESIRPTDPAPIVLGSPEGAELRQLRWLRPAGPAARHQLPLGRSAAAGRALPDSG